MYVQSTQWPPITKVLWNIMYVWRTNPIGTNTMYVHRMGYYMRLHAHVPMCSQRRIYREPVTWKLHMHGELPKEYSFIYIYTMSKLFASGTKLSGRSNKNKEKFSKGYAKWERVM